MSLPNFENLRVLQLAESLCDEIWEIVKRWDSFARWTVGKQLVETADGVGANIAEGAGKGSYQDNRRFVRIARGCYNETRYWVRRASNRGLIDADGIAALYKKLDRLGPMLNAYLGSIGPRDDDPGNDPRTRND